MEPTRSQADLIAAFEEGRVDGVNLAADRIDTHISHVFLTQDRAFKLKRAVTLPFLDFSTLERRQAACLAELEANHAFAREMYLGVRPVIALGAGRYRIGGDGDPVDWVVEMCRFAQADQFDELTRAGRMTPQLIEQTADAIAAAHLSASPVMTAGHTADLRGIIRELQATETHGAEQMGLGLGDASIFEQLDSELSHIDPLIEARRRGGCVCRTHGDLHLRNICLFKGRPTPFDALEFDVRLATTDRLYDLAYLLMDLIRLGHLRDANRLMNRYWDMAREAETGLGVLPFFMALRAAIRMAIDVEAENLAEADIYRQLAHRMLKRQGPRLVCIGGLSGVGKSTIARELAPRLPGPVGARLLRSDVLRKRSRDQNPERPLNDPSAYSDAGRAQVYEDLFAHGRRAYEAGSSVILDATFQTHAARATACELGPVSVTGIWLEAPLDVRLSRIAGRVADASDADVNVAQAQKSPDERGEPLGTCWHQVDASGSPDAVVRHILSLF